MNVSAGNSTSHIEIFKYILEIIKENDDDMDDLQETDMQLKYILHYASKRCNLEILKILLKPEFGDDFPLLRRKKDLTPIHYALKSCKCNLLQINSPKNYQFQHKYYFRE